MPFEEIEMRIISGLGHDMPDQCRRYSPIVRVYARHFMTCIHVYDMYSMINYLQLFMHEKS